MTCLQCSDAGLCGACLRLCLALLGRVTVSQCCKLGRIIFCPWFVKSVGLFWVGICFWYGGGGVDLFL
jgi:hypothetical protein